MAKEKYVVQNLMGCKYDRLPVIKCLGVEAAELEKYAIPEARLFRAEARARMTEAMKGHTDPAEYTRAARAVMLDNVIGDPARLRAETGMDPLPFFYVVACVKDGMKGDPSRPLPRGGIDEHRAGWPGNRCKLLPVHQAFLVLHAVRSGNPQEMLESKFGIDQTTISRQIEHLLDILVNPDRMPTAVAVADEIAEAPVDEVVEAIGHVLNFDVTEFKIEAPGNKESNDEAFSGKAQTTTAKAIFSCSKAGILIAMGDIMPGRKHDINALRDTLPFLGDLMRSLKDPDTPPEKRLEVNLDRGMVSADDEWPGAHVYTPFKRAKGQKELEPWQIEHNHVVDSDRAIIENEFRRMKVYRLIGGIFRGSVADLEKTVVFVTGIVNLQRMMGCIDPARSHRKHPISDRKPGGRSGRKPPLTFG